MAKTPAIRFRGAEYNRFQRNLGRWQYLHGYFLVQLDTSFPADYCSKKKNNIVNEIMLDGLITSKTRVRILMRLFLNSREKVYLRELASEYGLSSGQVSSELHHMRDAGFLSQDRAGRKIEYRANTSHPLFPELQSMARKALGMDRILDSIVGRLGNLEMALLLDDYAQGKDTGIVDLALVGDINKQNLNDLVEKTERYINRKIRTLILTWQEYVDLKSTLDSRPHLVLWERKAETNETAQS
jgi:DNA-binding transcriptional ArsR family regulator